MSDLIQLDELAARHIMGWKDSGPTYWEVKMGTTHLYAEKSRYSFSTSGDGMLLVMERMQELGFLLDLHLAPGSAVAKFKTNVNDPIHMGNASTAERAPTAVAKAALKALGIAF
jgi:hypothetical protein